MLRLRREMRAWGPDVALDVQGNLKGAVLTRLSGAPRRVGLPGGPIEPVVDKVSTIVKGREAEGYQRARKDPRADLAVLDTLIHLKTPVNPMPRQFSPDNA